MRLALLVALFGVAHADLRKPDVRPAMKSIVPALDRCYEAARATDPRISGVINTKLTIESEPTGIRLQVTGFDTHGRLGESREFLACVTKTLEATTLPAIAAHGSLDLIYPATFAPRPPDNRDRGVVDKAARALVAKRWRNALALAERGLQSTSLDGPFRRRLIEIAGIAACRANDARSRHYLLLASGEIEERIRRACDL